MTQSAGPLARRTLLRRILGAVGAATIVCASPNAGTAAIKISQKAVAYQDHPEGDKRCEKCVQFQAPNQCKVVDGTINPTSAIRPSARGTTLPKLRLQPDPSAAGFAHHASATGNLTMPLEMLNPQIAGWGILELARQEREVAKQRSQPQPTQTVPQPGSMEWFAVQNKSS